MPQAINVKPGDPPPNYVNPPTQGAGIQIANSIFVALVAISITLRVYTRARVPSRFGMDDLFAVSGSVCS